MNASLDPDFNPYAAPKASLPTHEGLTATSAGMWREGSILVLTKNALFPDYCVKCSAPANGYKLRRNLYYHPSGWYLLIFFNILIYAIVAMIVRKTAKLHVGVCPRHRAKRRNGILIGWGSFFLMIGLIVAGGALQLSDELRATLFILAPIVFVVGLFYSILTSRIVWAKRIDDKLVWLKGVGPEFLNEVKFSWPPIS